MTTTEGASAPVVAVGVDGSEGAAKALAFAAEEARLRGATLRVVQAWSVPPVTTLTYVPAELFDDARLEAERELDQQVTAALGFEPHVVVDKRLVEGPPAQALLEQSGDVVLLVVGSRGRGGFGGLVLGSVSTQVVHHATCPVTVVRG